LKTAYRHGTSTGTFELNARRIEKPRKQNGSGGRQLEVHTRKMDVNTKTMQDDMKTNQAELKSAITQIEWKKPASMEMKPEAAHEDVPLEDAARMPVGEPRKRRRDRNLDARRRRKQQERTKKKDRCRKNLVAADRRTTRRAKVARRKEIVIGRNRIRRRQPKKERSKGTRSRDVEELLHLKKGGKTPTVSEDGTEDSSQDWKL
jgi:hypothetical protein